MMNRFNNFLVGLLWLLAITLGATFWFNTMYGFNIFAAQHWQHLAYMQATGQAVKPSFYISIVVILFIMIFGLYKLLQPRFRQITMPVIDRTSQPQMTKKTVTTIQTTTTPVQQPAQPVSQPAPQPEPQPVPQPEQQPVVSEPVTPTPMATPEPQMARPPRLNIPTVTRVSPVPNVPISSTPQQTLTNPETDYAEIRNIFEAAGYVFKGMPKIKNVQTATVAIGSGEVLWIGAVGVKNADMQRAVQTLSDVFSDTLDDIEININAFIVASPDAAENSSTNILQFATVEDLRNYISGRPNTQPDEDERENFDAYSGYIGTVMDYIGKI